MMSPLLLLVGPTGVGKTAVGIELSTRLNGEIVSADSMQIYRGLDIGTAKATPAEQLRARHHLIDIREPHESYSAAQWADDARCAIEDIRRRGKQPIIVGGTGFYIRALLQPETLAGAAPDAELRARLEAEAAQHGAQHLHDRLRVLDAAAAERLHPNDVRRVIRAIEVALSPNSSHSQPQDSHETFTVFGLEMARDTLYRRLEGRIDHMLHIGFMDELRALVATAGHSSTAMQSLGYKQMLPALSNPDIFDACVELWKRDTRRYAKRQMTWFRHQLPTQWLPVSEHTLPMQTADEIAARWRHSLESLI
ncbi:MAG TPA: tRNA (adenosine(37)-N6)-dimethylallyltransferase MiaA [Abditibacteriaceae bacterium]|jgi:tRNA dimethylallyltransferase